MTVKRNVKLPSTRARRLIPILLVLVLAVIGIRLTTSSHADSTNTSYGSAYASNGTAANGATKIADSDSGSNQALSFEAAATGSSGNPTGEFYIVGDKIVAPNGSLYFPQGANMADQDALGFAQNSPYTADYPGLYKDVEAWGWNTIRLVTYCTPNAWYLPSGTTVAQYEAALNSTIQQYTSHDIVVDVTCFDISDTQVNGKDSGDTGAGYTAALNAEESFWSYMGTTYKNNPYVWFDPDNEALWDQTASQLVSWYTNWYNIIRATGAENIMVADVENDGQDAGWNGAPPIYQSDSGPALVAGKCNILFAMHNYGGLSDTIANYTNYSVYTTYWNNVHNANLAMFIEETGETYSSPAQDNAAGVNSSLSTAVSSGIGSLWWAAQSNDSFSLKANGNTYGSDLFNSGGDDVGLSTAGQQEWTYDHTTHSLGNFTGTYSASNCSSTK